MTHVTCHNIVNPTKMPGAASYASSHADRHNMQQEASIKEIKQTHCISAAQAGGAAPMKVSTAPSLTKTPGH